MIKPQTITRVFFITLISIGVLLGITGCSDLEEAAIVQDGYKITNCLLFRRYTSR
jgi:hypothetical protein